MTNERRKRIHRLYGILLSASIAAAAVCLMVACVSIYRSGDQPFSPESVAAAFAPIAIPVYGCLALVVIGFALDLFIPKEVEKIPGVKQYSMILKRMKAKSDPDSADDSLRAAISQQEKSRKTHDLITAGLLAAGSAVFLGYCLTNPFHPSEINDSMVNAMLILLPCMTVPFGYGIFAAYRKRVSMKKEIELLKQLPPSPSKQQIAHSKNDRSILILRCALLGIGGAILLYGLFNGGTADVLTKAINICTECVGLG